MACYYWQGWSAVASAGGSLLGSIIGAFSAKHETKKTNEANVEASREQNETQVAMNRENNEFAHDEAELAYQRELEKMQLEQQYNSPIEQMKRFQEAGVNPSVAFAGNMTQTVGGSSSAHAPMAQPHGSGVTPSMPTLRPTDYSSFAAGVSDSFLKSAEILKTFAEAKKQATENKYLDQQIQMQIDALQASNEGQKLANMITQMFGKDRAAAELALFAQQALTLEQQGKTEEARRLLMKSEQYLNYKLGDYHGENKRYLEQRNRTYLTEFAATLDNLKAQAAASRASAVNQYAQAQTEDELRQWRADLLKADKEVRDKQIDQLKGLITAIDQENLRRYLTPWEIKHLREMTIQDVEEQLKSDHWQNTLIGRFARFFGGASNMGAAAIGGASNMGAAAIRAGSIP